MGLPITPCAFCLILLGSVLALSAQETSTVPGLAKPAGLSLESLAVEAAAGWDSHYFIEGRDALDGGSIATASIDLAWERLVGGLWYGDSPDQPYEELHLSAGITYGMGDFDLEFGYTHLRFTKEQTHDDEVGAALVWVGLPYEIELGIDIYYSFDAEGYFSEFSACRTFEVNEQALWSLAGILGVNQDYISDGHDGMNHFALQLGFEYTLTEAISIGAYMTHSWAIDRQDTAPGDELLVDFFHGGVGMTYSF